MSSEISFSKYLRKIVTLEYPNTRTLTYLNHEYIAGNVLKSMRYI